MVRFLAVSLSCLFLFASCQPEEPVELLSVSGRQFPRVDKKLWPYFERFELEAAARGVEVDLVLAGIRGDIKELTQEHVAGQCSYGAAIDEHITIDRSFWNDPGFSEYTREMVVFHELGHCYLFRGHREDEHPDGSCVSIMRSGAGDCFDNYHSVTRAGYLDELFDRENP